MFAYNMLIAFTHAFYIFAYSIISIIFRIDMGFHDVCIWNIRYLYRGILDVCLEYIHCIYKGILHVCLQYHEYIICIYMGFQDVFLCTICCIYRGIPDVCLQYILLHLLGHSRCLPISIEFIWHSRCLLVQTSWISASWTSGSILCDSWPIPKFLSSRTLKAKNSLQGLQDCHPIKEWSVIPCFKLTLDNFAVNSWWYQ